MPNFDTFHCARCGAPIVVDFDKMEQDNDGHPDMGIIFIGDCPNCGKVRVKSFDYPDKEAYFVAIGGE